MKIPTIWNRNTNIAKRPENALPKARDFESAMLALKKASGQVEYRIIPMRCARYDKPFAVIYKRESDNLCYRIERIAKEAPKNVEKPGILTRVFEGSSSRCDTYDQSEFNHAGLSCPWCGDANSTVFCGKCRETYCGSTVITRADGSQLHQCVSSCGNQGVLSAYDALNGHQGKPASNGKGRLSQRTTFVGAKIGHEDRKRLPKT